jgi:chromosome segregation ATPase
MATFKKILLWICIVLFVLIAGFFGGWKYEEYRIRRNGEQSAAELKTKLELAESKLAELQSEHDAILQLAGKQREQLDSIRDIINESKSITSKHEDELRDIDATITDIERTVQRITEDFTKIQRIVESSGTKGK